MDTYKALVEMGFSEVRAASALRQANNDVNNALQVRKYVSSSTQLSSQIHLGLVSSIFSYQVKLNVNETIGLSEKSRGRRPRWRGLSFLWGSGRLLDRSN